MNLWRVAQRNERVVLDALDRPGRELRGEPYRAEQPKLRGAPEHSAAMHIVDGAHGEYDAYAIFEAPDNVSMASVVLAITAGGALASAETTVLMSVEETLEALAKGKSIGYRRPGESPVS